MEEQFIYLNKIKELTVKIQDLENQIRIKNKIISSLQNTTCKCQMKDKDPRHLTLDKGYHADKD